MVVVKVTVVVIRVDALQCAHPRILLGNYAPAMSCGGIHTQFSSLKFHNAFMRLAFMEDIHGGPVNRSKAAASLWLEAVTEVHPGRLGRVFTYVAQATNERPHASHEMMAEEVTVQDGIVRYVFLGR
jgi:hypothetical protein